MIKLSDIIEYKDVRLGRMNIIIGNKTKSYRALWRNQPLARERFRSLPSGKYNLKYKKYLNSQDNPWIVFTNNFHIPVCPLGGTTFDNMLPYIYVQHKDGTEVSEKEWRRVTSIMNASDNPTICIDSPIVKVDKELMEKPNSYELKDW